MLIVKDFLNGDNISLKKIVSARVEHNNPDTEVGVALTAYAG
jgi:hypothetical protein